MGVRERPTDKQTDRQKGRANKHAVIKAFREREREKETDNKPSVIKV